MDGERYPRHTNTLCDEFMLWCHIWIIKKINKFIFHCIQCSFPIFHIIIVITDKNTKKKNCLGKMFFCWIELLCRQNELFGTDILFYTRKMWVSSHRTSHAFRFCGSWRNSMAYVTYETCSTSSSWCVDNNYILSTQLSISEFFLLHQEITMSQLKCWI